MVPAEPARLGEPVDAPDESYDLEPLRISETVVDGQPAVEVELRTASPAWAAKSVVLRCRPDRLELEARVTGSGRLTEVQLLGGRAVLNSGACGRFRSSVEFASVFDPTPTEPVEFVRPATAAAALGAHRADHLRLGRRPRPAGGPDRPVVERADVLRLGGPVCTGGRGPRRR